MLIRWQNARLEAAREEAASFVASRREMTAAWRVSEVERKAAEKAARDADQERRRDFRERARGKSAEQKLAEQRHRLKEEQVAADRAVDATERAMRNLEVLQKRVLESHAEVEHAKQEVENSGGWRLGFWGF